MKSLHKNFILEILDEHYKPEVTKKIFAASFLIQYLDKKTRSVNRSSKSRASFANIYAIYVLVKDYIEVVATQKKYSGYKGMRFGEALKQMRLLPWGEKLQNHALNHRLNEEFKKFFSTKTKQIPLVRNLSTQRYWINENLLQIKFNDDEVNLADVIIKMIDHYISLKQEGYTQFIDTCKKLQKKFDGSRVFDFLNSILSEETDARLFEITSYCILKEHYKNHGYILYRTGRTNANDGGIDFVLKPEGRFFQVTEVLDFKKYFLDIDKLIHYPITFVIRTEATPEDSLNLIRSDAKSKYNKKTLKRYLACFEEVITLPILRGYLKEVKEKKEIKELLNELALQYKIEYNIKN